MTTPHARHLLFSIAMSVCLLSSGLVAAMPPIKSSAQTGVAPSSQDGSNGDDVVLPPAPSGATPATAMRLPNLPSLQATDSSTGATNGAASPVAPTQPAQTLSAPATAGDPLQTPANTAAGIELQKIMQRTGLSDAQLAQLQSAQARLLAGDESGALAAAQALTAELDRDAREYRVDNGQNLFAIAGQHEVYANSNLWPLLWWANLSALPEAWQTRPGLVLKVPAHPSIDQVSAALNYARKHNVLSARLSDPDLPAAMIAR